MKLLKIVWAIVAVLPLMSYAQIPEKEVQIKIAVQALPEDQRTEATVLGYNENEELVTLREGTNAFTCLSDNPFQEGFNAACYHKSLNAFMQRGRELKAIGKTTSEVFALSEEEAQSGKLQMPEKPATLYVLYGKDAAYNPATQQVENARLRWVVYIPYATPDSSGLPTGPMIDGGPWIMFPGTHAAHIMITPPQ